MDIWVFLIAGLIGGGCIGFVLGKESPRRCVDCMSNNANRYHAGRKDGFEDGVETAVALVRERSVEAKNTYTITKVELERIREDAVETAYV